MRVLGKLIFGAVALFAATFATAATAKADSFGVYVAGNGFGVSFSNYNDGYYYGPGYGYASYGGYNRCLDRWYRRHHRHCWNYGGYGYYGYAPYYRPYYNYRPFYRYGYFPKHRWYRHDRWYPRHGWRGHRDGWRGGWHGDRGWRGGREWRGGHGRHGH